jgi:hypothetical protein
MNRIKQRKNTNRMHKDTLFRAVLSNKDNFREAYNAISGSNYGPDTVMIETTLSGALIMGQINDVSFLIDGKLIVFIEHQSTINRNMPLRMLIYVGRVYEQLLAKENIYRDRAIEIPDAEFYVIYNGSRKIPERMTLRLSDMRAEARKNLPPKLELIVDIYNINDGYNPGLLSGSPALGEYETFVEMLRKQMDCGHDRDAALELTIAECKRRKILANFIKTYASEIENMIFTKWNLEDAKKVWLEEGREEGREEGIEIGMEKILGLIRKGVSPDEIEVMLKQKPAPRRW